VTRVTLLNQQFSGRIGFFWLIHKKLAKAAGRVLWEELSEAEKGAKSVLLILDPYKNFVH
jgi:hypothetical protein